MQNAFRRWPPLDFIYLEVNSAFENLTGLKNVVGKKVSEVIPGIRESYPILFEIYGRVALTGEPESFEIFLEPLALWLFVSVYSTEQRNILSLCSITSPSASGLRALRNPGSGCFTFAASPSDFRDKTLQMMLDEIEKETGSVIGFYHFLNTDQETLSLQSWSTNTLRNMCTAEGQGSHYNISQAGVWVDRVREQRPVIHNDYASLANRKGLPPGHAAIKREMVVPIRRGGRIVAIIGVGNKPTDYNATDVEIAQSLGQLSWEIFERIQAVDELQTAHAEVEHHALELERAYKDMESFSYAASHDLRAPLITIEGFSNILLEDYAEKLDDKGKDLLNRVSNSAKKMKQLVADLLAFSRVSTKEILKYDFNMEELAQKLVDELTPTIGERDIKFEIKQMPSAYGDLFMMNQVLLNLLSNAIKFTQTRENAMIEVGGYSENNENVYYVRDNGMGFDMQFSDRLFGLFQRIHSSQEVEGTGIGLVIVKNIIEKHGGRVWAEGKPDEGATFYFTLPEKEE